MPSVSRLSVQSNPPFSVQLVVSCFPSHIHTSRCLLEHLLRLKRSLTPSPTRRGLASSECCMTGLAQRLETTPTYEFVKTRFIFFLFFGSEFPSRPHQLLEEVLVQECINGLAAQPLLYQREAIPSFITYLFLVHTEDLWAHLAETSGKPVATVMSTWTQQMGYPVLSVEGRQVKSSHQCCLHKCRAYYTLFLSPT